MVSCLGTSLAGVGGASEVGGVGGDSEVGDDSQVGGDSQLSGVGGGCWMLLVMVVAMVTVTMLDVSPKIMWD